MRGKRNEPAFVTHTAAKLSEVLGYAVRRSCAMTTRTRTPFTTLLRALLTSRLTRARLPLRLETFAHGARNRRVAGAETPIGHRRVCRTRRSHSPTRATRDCPRRQASPSLCILARGRRRAREIRGRARSRSLPRKSRSLTSSRGAAPARPSAFSAEYVTFPGSERFAFNDDAVAESRARRSRASWSSASCLLIGIMPGFGSSSRSTMSSSRQFFSSRKSVPSTEIVLA